MDEITNLLSQAIGLHREGNLQEAVVLYDKVLSLQPDNPDALHLLGLVTRRTGNLDLAIELMERALVPGQKPRAVGASR